MSKGKNRYSKILETGSLYEQKSKSEVDAHSDQFSYVIPEEAKKYAGVQTVEDWDNLDRQYEQARRDGRRVVAEKPFSSRREALSNTVRYRQVPGLSSLHGGRSAPDQE